MSNSGNTGRRKKEEWLRQQIGKRMAACDHMIGPDEQCGGTTIAGVGAGFVLPLKEPEIVYDTNGRPHEVDVLAVCPQCMRPDRDFFKEHWAAVIGQFGGTREALN